MKSCLIIGNPDSPPDKELRYYNIYPTILYLFMISGFTHVYLTPNNAYERMAFFDYSRWKPTLETLTLIMYDFSCTELLVLPSGSALPEGLEMGNAQSALDHVTHVLYVGFPALPTRQSHQTCFNLTLEQFREGPIEHILNLSLWMEG